MRNNSRRLAGLLHSVFGLALLLAGAAPAWAQTNFGYTGTGTQSYTVPAGVTKLNVTAIGGGGSGNGGPSSAGARVDATVPVTPGEVLTVVVGGAPNYNTNAGGYNGGGNGSNNNSGGGGSTDLRRAAANGSTGDYLTGRNALLVAGGGGGGNGANAGGSGGTPAGSTGGGSFGGGGASQTGPGAAAGSAGAGSGATGGYGVNGGGGGGGGYYGGGGASKSGFSSTASGGGGGSSWVLAAGSNISYATSGALYGSLAITPTPPTVSSFTPATGTFGITVTITGDFVNGATGVLFNGIAASSFALVNATTITAVVPSSTTGPISVVGPGSTGTSASNFTPIYLQVTARTPARHALAAATTTTVGITLDQAPTAASAAGIRIFSSQYKGRRTASAGVSGNTATLTPAGGSFRPGEVVQVSAPPTVQSSGGTRALAQVYQFTTAATGTGRGNFYGGSDPVVGSTPAQVVPADVDGDGDLDLVVTAVAFNNTGPSTAYVRLNSGGTFSGGSDVAVGGNPAGLAVGDVDGDGDLDIVTANDNANTASVRLNSGGTFGGTQEVSVGAGPAAVVLGDVDGDGDLDLITANYNHGNGSSTASVRLNGGDASGSNTGVFSAGSNPTVINNASGLALGDVDNDGDLDLLTYAFGNTVNVRLNNGGGTFAGGITFTVPGYVSSLVLGDVNADGYLDAVTADYNNNTASVRLNNGSGTFAGGSDPGFATTVVTVALGDVDADGDLDLLVANGSQVSVRLNNGSGTFAGGPDVATGGLPYGLALADVDGDNDLDLLAANYSASGTMNVRLNLPLAPTITSFTPTSGLPGRSVTITGTDFTGTTAVTFNGTPAPGFVVNSATQITVSVPAAATSGLLAVTTPSGTATSAASFTVVRPPVISSFTPGSGPVGTSVAITGNDLTGATAVVLNGTAGSITGTPTATNLSFTVAAGSTSGAITLATPVGTATSTLTPMLRLQATGGTSSDNTAYLDQVEILNAAGAIVAGGIGNGSFETGAPAGTLTNPGTAVAPWTFGGSARLSTTASPFAPPAPPDNSAHVVVLQLGGCYVEQALSLAAGTYQVRFQLAQRQCCATPYDQGINVLINGVLVGTSLSTSSAGYVSLVSAPFTVSAAGTFTVIPPPTLTAVAPNPGGLGQSITLTGTNLGSPTALTINGANALAGIVSNTGTSLVVRVPATATASGSVSITTVAGTATLAFTVMAPPGNALAFDGVDDYVSVPASTPVPLGNAAYTVEAWVNPNSMTVGSILGWGNYGSTNQANGFSLSTTGLINYWWGNDLQVATPSLVGHWHHVAATYDGTTRTLYLDGVAIGADVPGVHAVPNANNLRIGSNSNGAFTYLNGRLDEVRVYSVALTPAQLAADMTSTAAAVPASLVLYYNLDQGTPATASTGNNAGLTTVYDLASATPGTLTNFALASGNTTSNYVESYALVVPAATAASARTATGFTANWTAPAVGTVDNGYRLDVSTSSTFASAIAGSPFTVSSTSQAVTGLSASTTYYYRVRADKTSVTGQGAYSNTITVCPPPVATAQNVSVTLDASGSATVAATAVNNGSTANCGAAPAGALSVSPGSFSCADAVTLPATNAALSFNGTTQYVEGTNANLPLGNTARTIEAWVYPTAASANGIVFNYGTPTGNQRAGILLSNGNLYYVGEGHDLRGNIALAVNAWNHVAATFDGTNLRLYVNGVLDVQAATSAFNTVGTVWRIAQRSYPQTGEFLTGRVDEVRVWNVARTAAQIAAARTVSLPGGTSGLVASYRLNENSGSTTADASPSNSPGTLYNAPAWTTGAPVTPGVPATLTVTDASGASSTAPAIITVLDNTLPAAAGSGPLPAAPVLATSNVPEAGGYGVLYQLDMPTATNFNSLSAIPYAVNNSGAAIANPARVAYFMELNNGVSTKWVWASMDNFASNLTQLGLPNPTSNNVSWHQSVNNLNVFSSTGAGVTTGTSLGTGRVEMWPWNYTQGNIDNVLGANGSTYDFGDEVNLGSGNYGSFQVHNVTAGQTVLAYNNWGSNGGNSDVGIGNQASGSPDWTFASNAGGYTVKRLYILVPNNGAFTQAAMLTLNAAGTATLTQGQVYTGAADNCGISTVTITPSTFSCANTGQNLVTVAVADASGNRTTQSAFVTVSVPTTPTTTWNGASSTVWTDCANWSFGKVPDAATSVIIPTGQPRYPTLTTGTSPVLSLTIDNGGSLTLNSGATLQVNGNLANSGTATFSGTVAFVGSAAPQTLSNGSGFSTVTVNKPSGTVQLTQNLTINSALTLTSGTLTTTGSYQVNLGGSATLSESETSYVLGKVVVNRTLVPGTAEAFSGLGLTLTPAPGSMAPGSTQVTRTTGTAISGAGTSQSILRNFNIVPTVNGGLNVTMNFAYFTHELNGIPVGNLALFKSVSGGTPWIPQRGTTAGANVVTKAGITDFSVWTLGNSANPLPVELTDFTATLANPTAVRLAWATASEQHSQAFEVERSLSGVSFERIGTVAAAGSSSAPRSYELTDRKLPAGAATLYYRLKQVDADGTFRYSPVRMVALTGAAEGLALYPNPAHGGAATLTGALPGALVTVFDALGRAVAAATADAAGTAALVLPAGLATGVYVVRAGSLALRLTVE